MTDVLNVTKEDTAKIATVEGSLDKITAFAKPVPPSPPLTTITVKPVIAAKLPAPAAKTAMGSLSSRVSDMMGFTAGKPPSGIVAGNTDDLHAGYFHVLLYGNPSSYKTSTAARFMGPEKTRIIVTRRAEQMIPLAQNNPPYKFVVVNDAESLRYMLLHPEKQWPDWAEMEDRVLVVDDVTEGVAMLVDDHKFVYNEKTGETTELRDPRQAYKKAGDEMHDLLKINLGKRQHTVLTAVERGYDVDGTIDFRIEPDIPNKITKLIETELEYVFYMEDTDTGKMLTQIKVVNRMSDDKKKSWREITFAKAKLPMKFLGLKVLAAQEDKDLKKAWDKITASLKGEFVAAPKPTLPASLAGSAVKR